MAKVHHNDGRSGAKGKSRGSVKNRSRLDAFAARASGGDADWGGCDPQRLQAAIVAITAMGGAITFGLSRDMGAHSLTLMLDGGRETVWLNGGADLDEELAAVIATLDTMD